MDIDSGGRLASLDALRRAGRMDDAVVVAEAWTRVAPLDPGAWSALAATFAEATRPDLAMGAWERALALNPASTAALCGQANALAAVGRAEEAATLFQQALAGDAKAFDAHFGLALLAFNAGDAARADALVAGLETDHGERPGVIWLAARIAAAADDFPRAMAGVERLLARVDLPDEPRAEALLLRAHILDRQGLATGAFAAAMQGKAIQRQLFANRAAAHESEFDKLERLTAWFSDADRGAWAISPTPSPVLGEADGHVFLLGFPRSGTTLIEQALAGHPRIVTLEEAPTLAEPYQVFLRSAEGLGRLAGLSPDEAQAWRARYWQVVRAHGIDPMGRVFLDKAPAETLSLPVIAKLFPRARILFAVRDPRDVVLSCFINGFQMNAMTYAFTTLVGAAACYGANMKLAGVYRALLPLSLREVRYEALIEDFGGELKAIAAFIGLEYHPAMADVAATAERRIVRTPSAAHVRAGVNRQGLAHWRAYAAELTPVAKALAPWIEQFGYSSA